mgnify:CR=1 FL=1
MRISLIGMSGCGKSRWSQRLEGIGFKRYPCDDWIAARLFPTSAGVTDAIELLGRWMGFPFEEGYAEREATYLRHEIEVLREIVGELEESSGDAGTNVVVDTTGSVVYAGEELLGRLKASTTLVHLATPPEVQGAMLADYLANPRPVLWHGIFSRERTETTEQALKRCYALLLSSREELYRECADLTLDYARRTAPGYGIEEFLRDVALAAAATKTQGAPDRSIEKI